MIEITLFKAALIVAALLIACYLIYKVAVEKNFN